MSADKLNSEATTQTAQPAAKCPYCGETVGSVEDHLTATDADGSYSAGSSQHPYTCEWLAAENRP